MTPRELGDCDLDLELTIVQSEPEDAPHSRRVAFPSRSDPSETTRLRARDAAHRSAIVLWQCCLVPTDTLYERLGLDETATSDEIRDAYRTLSKTFHPDAGGTSVAFRQIREAHDTLIDPGEREAYDRTLRGGTDAASEGPSSTRQRPNSERAGSESTRDSRSNRANPSSPGADQAVPPRGATLLDRLRQVAAKLPVLVEMVVEQSGWEGRRRRNLQIGLWAIVTAISACVGAVFVADAIFVVSRILRIVVMLGIGVAAIALAIAVASARPGRS